MKKFKELLITILAWIVVLAVLSATLWLPMIPGLGLERL